MSLPIAQLRHVFGVRSGVSSGVSYQDEQTLVYSAGSNIVLYNIDQKSQRFITGPEKGQVVTAMAITPNRRYVAIAERGEKAASISIYDMHTLKKKKVLQSADSSGTSGPTTEFVSLAFSPDSKYLASQGGKNGDWTLFYWMWEKSKVMATVKATNQNTNAPINQVQFNPQDNTIVSVVGQGILKVFRYTEGSLKLLYLQKNDPLNYLSHAWVSEERIIAGSENGKWVLLENGEVKMDCNLANQLPKDIVDREKTAMTSTTASTTQPVAPSRQVTAIASFGKGFACAFSRGIVFVFERTEDKDFFRRTRTVRIPADANSVDPSKSEAQLITHLCFSPSEETLIATTELNQLYSFTISSAEIGRSDDQQHFDNVAQPFHSGPITGLDVCVRKPLVATCSSDRSVRIWNYETCTLELYKEFAEEAYSVALHPSGLYILVGFSDKLRLMNLLIDDVRTFKEFTVRGCRECAFSNGGNLFAAVQSNVIQVYSCYTFENVSNLKGHNGKIRSVVWSADDSKLVSCGLDGAVYEWEPLSGKRIGESVLKTCQYTSVALSNEGKTTFAVGSDKTIKEIADSQILRDVPVGDSVLTSIVLSHSGKMLFAATNSGCIRAIKYPLSIPGEWQDYTGHAATVNKMKITLGDEAMVTVGDDGIIMIWKVQDKEGRTGMRHDKDVGWAEEILITKSDLEEKNMVMSELKTRVDELKLENEYQLRLKDMNYNEKIKELTEKFIQEMESLKTKNQVLKNEKEKADGKHEEELQELLEKHGKELQDLEASNNQKLMLEYEKYQELQAKSQKMQEDYERQLQEMEDGKERALQELTEYYETKLNEKVQQLDQEREEGRVRAKEHETTKQQIEEDADREILDTKNKYERKLREEKEMNMKLKGETGIMKKKFTSLQKEIEDHKDEIKKYQQETQKLNNIIKNLEKDIQGLKKEIQERDETIQDKEKRIYDLKKKNQELEKFKFVLDYKIKELKKQIEPRENEIKTMKEQIQEMESELERFHKQNSQLELTITELKQKLKATEKELQDEQQHAHDVEAIVKRFRTDLHNCVGYIQDPKMLKDSIIALYKKHQSSDTAVEAGLDADIQREYARQREHLESSVSGLRKKLAKDSELHRQEVVRIMQENVSLIKEINDLRRELKQARTRMNDLEAVLGLHRKTKDASSQQFLQTLLLNVNPTAANKALLEQDVVERDRVIELQRLEIKKLREQLASPITMRLGSPQLEPVDSFSGIA